MKKFGFMLMAVATMALSLVSCNPGGKEDDDPIVNPNPGGEEEVTLPTVEGTEGAVTLVIKFDQAPCDGYEIRFVGDYDDTSWDFATAHAMEAIGDGWYKIVLYPNAGGTINGRPLQLGGEKEEWSNDWSHDGADIIGLKGVEEDMIADSGYGEINLAFGEAHAADAVVVFIECKKWNLPPCTERLGAGSYTFTANFAEALPAGAVLYMTGNFGSDNKEWGDSDREMTKVSDTQYTWTGDVPENFQWKVFYVLDGAQVWCDGGNVDLITEDDLVHTFAWPAE